MQMQVQVHECEASPISIDISSILYLFGNIIHNPHPSPSIQSWSITPFTSITSIHHIHPSPYLYSLSIAVLKLESLWAQSNQIKPAYDCIVTQLTHRRLPAAQAQHHSSQKDSLKGSSYIRICRYWWHRRTTPPRAKLRPAWRIQKSIPYQCRTV